MANNEYVGDFGITRIIGTGEGVEHLNRSDSIINYGYRSELVIDIDTERDAGQLPQANEGTALGRGIAGIPAGSVIKSVALIVKELTGAAPSLTVNAVKKDGTVIGALGTATANVGYTNLTGALVTKGIGEDKGFVVVTPTEVADGVVVKGYIAVEFC